MFLPICLSRSTTGSMSRGRTPLPLANRPDQGLNVRKTATNDAKLAVSM